MKTRIALLMLSSVLFLFVTPTTSSAEAYSDCVFSCRSTCQNSNLCDPANCSRACAGQTDTQIEDPTGPQCFPLFIGGVPHIICFPLF